MVLSTCASERTQTSLVQQARFGALIEWSSQLLSSMGEAAPRAVPTLPSVRTHLRPIGTELFLFGLGDLLGLRNLALHVVF